MADAARGAAETPHDYRQQRQCFDFFYAVASCLRKPGACYGVMRVICSESRDQDIDVRGHSSAASKRDRLLVPSTPLRKPPCLADRGKSFNVPFDGALCLRSLSANPSSTILVSVVRSFAASAFALATRSSRRSRVVFMAPRIQNLYADSRRSAASGQRHERAASRQGISCLLRLLLFHLLCRLLALLERALVATRVFGGSWRVPRVGALPLGHVGGASGEHEND